MTLDRPQSGIPDTERSEYGRGRVEITLPGLDSFDSRDFPEESAVLKYGRFRSHFLVEPFVVGKVPQLQLGFHELQQNMTDSEIEEAFGEGILFDRKEVPVCMAQLLMLHLKDRSFLDPAYQYVMVAAHASAWFWDPQIDEDSAILLTAYPRQVKMPHQRGTRVFYPML